MQNKETILKLGSNLSTSECRGKDREIGEIVELGKNIGSTKVIYEHFIGLRVPADMILSITIRGSGRGPATGGIFFERRPAAIGEFGDRLIAPSAITSFKGLGLILFST